MLQKQLAKAEQKSEKSIERTIEEKEDIAEVKVAKHEHKPQGIKVGGAGNVQNKATKELKRIKEKNEE